MPILSTRHLATIEQYLYSLNEEQLDRVITAQDWCHSTTVDNHGRRCLVGHAADYISCGVATDKSALEFMFQSGEPNPAVSFDRLAESGGLAKAVPLVKSLAARIAAEKFPLRTPAPVEQMEEVGA